MPPLNASKIASLLAGLAILSACSPGGGAVVPAQPQAQEARNCPPIVLREGTAILREGPPEALRYIASIAETSRSCRVIDGALHIEVGIAGRVTPGVAAPSGQVQLPLRVAVVRGTEVLYSNLGRLGVSIAPGSGAQTFRYVDRAIRLSEPAAQTINIQVGFDERN